ncbi:MAG: MBL fold metallo-hydrolase [Clostridia bacterium]|nr:MBL fold metallo-hydrolase [Clostridia bacterium]
MTVTVLLENTSHRPDLSAEHGLSLLIEANGHRILFDMGQTDLFARNADTLGIDLSTVDTAILSHGHYDHGGGLPAFLSRNQAASVYISRHAFGRYFNGTGKYIGLDPALQESPRLIFTQGETDLSDGFTLCVETSLPTLCDLGTFGLTAEMDGIRIPDPFDHEQYLLVREGGKRILFSGCSHRGILNIVDHFHPDILVGGFHVSKMPTDHTLSELAQTLAAYGTDFYTGHCTGLPQYGFIARYMPRLHYISTGERITL